MSLGDEDFIVPEEPIEQEHFKCRLIATARSLKKKQRQLQDEQDTLNDRWTKVLAAEEFEATRSASYYHNLTMRLLSQCRQSIKLLTNLTDHHVGGIEWLLTRNISPHPHASLLRPGAIRRTCETNWKTTQDNQDRSKDHGGAPQHMTMTVIPDTLTVNPAGPNTINQT